MRIMTSLCICDLVKLHYNHNLTLRIFNHIYLPMHMQLWGLPPNTKGTDKSVGGVGAGEKCMELPSTAALQPQVPQKKQGNIPSQPQKESMYWTLAVLLPERTNTHNKTKTASMNMTWSFNWIDGWLPSFLSLSFQYPTRTAPSLPLSHLMWSMVLLVGHH